MEGRNTDETKKMMEFIGREKRMKYEKILICIIDALKRAGAQKVQVDKSKMQVSFIQSLKDEDDTCFDVKYVIEILTSDGKVNLCQEMEVLEYEACAENILQWFVRKRNRELDDRVIKAKYVFNKEMLCLQEHVLLENRSCSSLVEAIIKMNQIVERDKKNIKLLNKGRVPGQLSEAIKVEFDLYNKEMQESKKLDKSFLDAIEIER